MDTSDIDFNNRIGSGGTADVYAVSGHPDIVAKLYNQPQKINFKKLTVLSDRLSGETFAAHIAIPLDLVSGPGGFIGFTQRYFDSKNYLELDHWIEGPLRRMLSPVQRGLTFRLEILRSLAVLIEGLHGKYIAIVDLKPSNILVHRITGQVAIVDCDAFCILDANGRIEYPAQEVTVGYCSGDALRKGLSPTQLSYKQDSFAFAVISFQLLNNGIHPYQGVIQTDVTDHNLEALTKAGVYPYGQITPTEVTPLPISVHSTLPTVLLEAFERSFERGRKHLDIGRWSKLISNILANNLVEQCPDSTRSGVHWKFSGHPCSDCKFDTLTRRTESPSSSRTRSAQGATASKKPAPKLRASPNNNTNNQGTQTITTVSKKPSGGHYKLLLGLAAVVLFIMIVNAPFKINSITESPSPKIDWSSIPPDKENDAVPPKDSIPGSTQTTDTNMKEQDRIKSLSPASICRTAMDWSYRGWETRSTFAPYVKEATARGYTIPYCLATLGVAAQPNKTDSSRVMTTPEDLDAATQSGNHLKTLSEVNVCGGALDPSKTTWDNRPMFKDVVGEANRRGYDVESCRTALGLSTQQSTATKDFSLATSCDIEGSDIAIFKETPLTDCKAQCLNNPSCSAFVYNKWNSLCVLKANNAPKIIDVSADCYTTNATSGFDNSRVWYFKELSNRRFMSASIEATVSASTLAVCRKACNDNNNCFGANFNRLESKCELLNQMNRSSTPDDRYDALYVYTPR